MLIDTRALLESNREFDDAPVGVIPAEAGIQDSWMPDQVGHDNARAGADSSQFQHSLGERMGSRDTAFNFCFIPTELSGMAITVMVAIVCQTSS